MKTKEVHALHPGLYKITWKGTASPTSSYVSIGSTVGGKKFLMVLSWDGNGQIMPAKFHELDIKLCNKIKFIFLITEVPY